MKKLAFGFMSLLLITALVGCSSQNSNSASEITQLKAQVAELTKENQNLKLQLEEAKKEEVAAATPDPTPSPVLSVLELNKPLSIADFAEVTITKASFTSKVVPPNPDSFYSYYEVKDPGNIYLDTVIKIKSLLTSEKSSEEFATLKVKYDNKYEYDSFSTIEESGGSNLTYTSITSIEPLKTGSLHFIAELPKEASTDKKPIAIIVTLQGKDYTYTLR
ncbi:hypothetical protein [Paenibacillus sp. MMO-58]|uniref:hypothetical protein n=1 Tax=Paenibacillus sp. MMO-58 TaxID=3081290 RepID=UPI00301AB1E4